MYYKVYYHLHRLINWVGHKYHRSQIKGKTNSLSLKGRINLAYPWNIYVGENCSINEGTFINAIGKVVMGNNVTISMCSKILTRTYDTSEWYSQCQLSEPQMKHLEKEVFLNDHTWICAGATILPGVKITGVGVIVAAGSVLSNSIEEDYVLVAGSPAKIIKHYKRQ